MPPLPSLKDSEAQLEYQMKLLGNSDSTYSPCVGIITSPFTRWVYFQNILSFSFLLACSGLINGVVVLVCYEIKWLNLGAVLYCYDLFRRTVRKIKSQLFFCWWITKVFFPLIPWSLTFIQHPKILRAGVITGSTGAMAPVNFQNGTYVFEKYQIFKVFLGKKCYIVLVSTCQFTVIATAQSHSLVCEKFD